MRGRVSYRNSDIAHDLKVIPSSYSFVTGEEGELYLYTANNRFNVRESAIPSLAIGAHPRSRTLTPTLYATNPPP